MKLKMQYTIPSHNLDLFQSLIGQKITNVSRRLLESDLDLENYEQMGDGPTELVFSNGQIVAFYSWVRILSIGITQERIERQGMASVYKDITNNSFWKERIGQTISKIVIAKSIYATEKNAMEFAIEFEFENNMKVCIEHTDNPDSLIVTEENKETKCTKTVLE